MSFSLSVAILHFGLMDGSAGIAISHDRFITVSDEVNAIMEYIVTPDSSGTPALNLNDHAKWFQPIHMNGEFREADIEGAAQVGPDTIYWISSHGCAENKKTGEPEQREERQVFFATHFQMQDGHLEMKPTGQVYRNLLHDLTNSESLKKYHLDQASRQMPKSGPTPENPHALPGLNIESLCTALDGQTLYIGFRNPIPQGRGLIVPLRNAAALTSGTPGTTAHFGDPIELDLHGLGLRDMICWKGRYLIIAGSFTEHLDKKSAQPISGVPASKLFLWTGDPHDPPQDLQLNLAHLNPEALIRFPNEKVLILSDDGSFQKKAAKDKKPSPTFRSLWLQENP